MRVELDGVAHGLVMQDGSMWVVVHAFDGRLLLQDAVETRAFDLDGANVSRVVVSQDGGTLAVLCDDGTLRAWDRAADALRVGRELGLR